MAFNIVLLGGGYVSVWACRSIVSKLGSAIDKGLVNITVVCPEEHHVFHGWTAEAMTEIIKFENRLSPLKEIMPKATIIKATAEGIDKMNQLVKIKHADGRQESLPYNHLLLGIGSYDSDAVDGLKEFGYQVKALPALQRTMNDIKLLVEQAAVSDVSAARQLLQFVVAGGGFTGVEVASNLAEYLGVLLKQYPVLQYVKPRITLVHSGKEILPALQPGFNRMIKYAQKQLDKYGVHVIHERRISKVRQHGVWLDSGAFINTSMVISTVGQSRITLAGTTHMHRDASGRLLTDEFLRLAGEKNIWGGGDACHVLHCKSKTPCPSNALWAIKHGEYAGKNIARAVKGEMFKPFNYKGLGQSASLGLNKGITELYGMQFTGVMAWWMRWFFFNYFMPSKKTMLRSMGDWMTLLIWGRTKVAAAPATKPSKKKEVEFGIAM